ncbi:choice-of-anchor Q domain-containing protein [Paenibacillus sp. GCM10023252]|uniref:choice-of-anchor Q domain-containing protein n=1 Tax=Paenibacillus sp. GCM10023252 TaxID=3252649 RepID=UPI00361F9CB4
MKLSMVNRRRMSLRYMVVVCICLLLASTVALQPAEQVHAAGTIYYVDDVGGNDGNSGTSTGSAWKTISKVNSITSFQPGDQILFKRGGTFAGALQPKGSGSSGSPIKIGAYGSGSLPLIDGSGGTFGVKLLNQQYWEIASIEVKGGSEYGIVVTSDLNNQTYTYFRINNVVVRDVTGTSNDPYMGGIIFRLFNITGSKLNDVIVDGATVYNIKQAQGIALRGANETKSSGIIVRNSTAHNTYGNGILIACAENVLIENNVAYETGKATTPGTGWPTPNGIWTWWTNNAVVQNNESYLAHSWGVDGGGFDIDYYNQNNTYQYNYAHDNDGYGISVFAANSKGLTSSDAVTDQAIVRYNVLAYNGREAGANGAGQGSIYISQWDNGTFGSVRIYNNTVYHSPNTGGAYGEAFVEKNPSYLTGSYTRLFKNNLIYSTVSGMVSNQSNVYDNNNNLYYSTTGSHSFRYNGISYTSFSAYKSGSGKDGSSLTANPQLNNPTYHGVGLPTTSFTLQSASPAINAGANVGTMGSQDFFGNSLPTGSGYDIGAHEFSGAVSLLAEAEQLSYTNSGDYTANYSDSNASGGSFSGYDANVAGDYIEYTIPVSETGTYALVVGNKNNYNRGTYQVSVDGVNVGSPFDQYGASASYPVTAVGNVTFSTTGNHTVRFTVTGKHASSSDYELGIDYIRLTK